MLISVVIVKYPKLPRNHGCGLSLEAWLLLNILKQWLQDVSHCYETSGIKIWYPQLRDMGHRYPWPVVGVFFDMLSSHCALSLKDCYPSRRKHPPPPPTGRKSTLKSRVPLKIPKCFFCECATFLAKKLMFVILLCVPAILFFHIR